MLLLDLVLDAAAGLTDSLFDGNSFGADEAAGTTDESPTDGAPPDRPAESGEQP